MPLSMQYIAGLFDGEGCIGFSRVRTTIFIRTLVVNTNRDILERLRDIFGGDIAPLAYRKDGWKPSYQWRLSWSRAIRFLDAISPWLVIKAPQVELAFAWDAIRMGCGNRL